MSKDVKIGDALCRTAMNRTSLIKMKKDYFFNWYFQDCILNLCERTIECIEVENFQLKFLGVNLGTTISKLVVIDEKHQRIRENNIQLRASCTNRTMLSGLPNELNKVSNLLTSKRAKEFETQFDLSTKFQPIHHASSHDPNRISHFTFEAENNKEHFHF